MNDFYKKIVSERRIYYKTIKKVYCPCLKENITFNSKGFYHFKYDGLGKMRPIKEQLYRLDLLHHSVPTIKYADKIYQYRKTSLKFPNKQVEYWELRGKLIGNMQISVILRRAGNGKIVFHSIMKKKI